MCARRARHFPVRLQCIVSRSFWRLLSAAAILILLAISPASGAPPRIVKAEEPLHIVVEDDTDLTRHIVRELQGAFPEATVAPAATITRPSAAVYIAVGPSALRALMRRPVSGVAIAVFTASHLYNEIVAGTPDPRRLIVTGIYADPSPADQLRLTAAIFKKRTAVAVLITERTAHLLPVLDAAALQTDTDLQVERVDSADKLSRALNRVSTAPVLLALPDSSIYSAQAARQILLSTYRRNQAVVGFSESFVNAGALASTYSTVEDIIAQVREMLVEYGASGRLPSPQFPKYFRVATNDHVARSLNLLVDDTVRQLARKPGSK